MVTFKSMPPRTQWAIKRLLNATKSEGITAFQLGYSFDENGNVGGHASVFDADENQWFYWLDDGEWLAGSEVD